ncbi:MAG: hypothetical protein K6G19_10340 [Lachnospiraceae bacterium]|nr:hypothetical protein [Lachnospiraceae bacterium]
MEAFISRENEANSARRQPIDDLPYITIPEELFHIKYNESVKMQEVMRNLDFLKDKKILNLTGISNTDLKLKYGAANLPELSECDERYTLLVRSLQSFAECLSENGSEQDAIRILEFSISTGSDILSSYTLLAGLYEKAGTPEKINTLKEKAVSLNSLTAPSIMRMLEKASPDT